MTVKLAKFFTSSNSSSSGSGSGSGSNNSTNSLGVAPTTPISTSNAHNYYHVTNNQMQHQQQQHNYNPYMDDDDNMSLYSTTASIMTSRDHPFNNSQRPLLGNERKAPQLLLNKKKMNAACAINQTQHHQQQQQQQQQQYKSCISPYVQQQKRDSAKGLHGFNDFDILSQQYNNHLQSPHIGYPYGSPPSPTANSNDFVFDTLQQQQQQHQQVKCNSSTFMETTSMPPTTTTMMATSKPHYGNISKYTAIVSPTYNHLHTHEQHSDINEEDYYFNTNGTVSSSKVGQGYMGKPSRFEDDFCCRRNVEFSKNPNDHIDTLSHDSGPFIFGITHEQQQHSNLQPRSRTAIGRHGFSDSSDTVIDTIEDDDANDVNDVKYSELTGRQAIMQSTSDTSSSSRDSNSNKGAKFLLRKSKSKKNTKDKQCNNEIKTTTATTTTTRTSQKATIKCVVVGDGAVGKTNLILSYLENRFNTEHIPTASDIYNADVMVNDSPVHLTLCDTAGQDTLDPLRELCYPDSDVFLLCFSVAKPESFHAIKTKWAPKFSKTKAALILVGTQTDLRTNSNVLNKLQSNGEKPISYADAWDLATTIGAKYIETSSVTQDKVKEVFDTAIWEGLAPTTLPPTPPLWKKLFCLA